MNYFRSARIVALVLAATIIVCLVSAPAAAQASDSTHLWGFSIPESPAFTFLNASPAEVTRPTRPRDLAFALANGLDSLGRVQQGLAVDVVPWPWIPGFTPRLSAYQDRRRWWIYAVTNTGISLGTIRSAGDSASTDVAVGIRTILFDRSDPMANRSFTDSLGNRSAHCREAKRDTSFVGVHDTLRLTFLRGDARDEVRVEVADTARILGVRARPRAAERAPCIRAAEEEWRKEWLRENWNRPSLAVAFAFGSTLERSLLSDIEFRGFSAWASGALPVGRRLQAIGQVRVDQLRSSPDSISSRTLSGGIRGIYGSEKANAYAEVLHGWSGDDAPAADRRETRWSAGIEFRAAEDLWLSTGFGQRFAGVREDEDPVFLIANLRWNVATGPRIGR
jgi:hypothetical protein